MEVIEEKPISIWELEAEIKKIKKRDKELNYRVGKVEEYLNFCQQIKPTNLKELKKALLDLKIPRVREMHINKIIDIMPKTADEARAVLNEYPITIAKTNFESIARTVKKFI